MPYGFKYAYFFVVCIMLNINIIHAIICGDVMVSRCELDC